jgi:adenylylsulfate kinase
MITETHKRTVTKMITYRLTAWLLTIPIMYWMTGNLEQSIEGSVLIHIVLSLDYYVHERIWLKVKWGLEHKESSGN